MLCCYIPCTNRSYTISMLPSVTFIQRSRAVMKLRSSSRSVLTLTGPLITSSKHTYMTGISGNHRWHTWKSGKNKQIWQIRSVWLQNKTSYYYY